MIGASNKRQQKYLVGVMKEASGTSVSAETVDIYRNYIQDDNLQDNVIYFGNLNVNLAISYVYVSIFSGIY